MINCLPLICGISGKELTREEEYFFQNFNPWGIILFSRNCHSKDQLKELVCNIRSLTHKDIQIMIDQEGGRVHRLVYSSDLKLFPASFFGKIYIHDKKAAKESLILQCKIISKELNDVGININTFPVLDLPRDDESGVIGDRSFSQNKLITAELGKISIETYISMGINPVIKHIPGHGRARVDSHLDLPIVDTNNNELIKTDFYPFKFCNFSKLAMTAHIIFSEIDSKYPATISSKVIRDVIRGHINFNGLLMTDDISMKALRGKKDVLSIAALKAGCDLILHCNGDMKEMLSIAEALETKMYKIDLSSNLMEKNNKNIEFNIHDAMTKLENIVTEYVD